MVALQTKWLSFCLSLFCMQMEYDLHSIILIQLCRYLPLHSFPVTATAVKAIETYEQLMPSNVSQAETQTPRILNDVMPTS